MKTASPIPPFSQSQRQTRQTGRVKKFATPHNGFIQAASIKASKPFNRKLPPNDPDAVLGAQPIVNVVKADEDYTMGQNDYAVLVQGSYTITLAENPLTVTPILVIADSGTVTVDGGANPIQGGPVTLVQGTMTFFSFSPLSGEWSVLAAVGSGGGGGNTIFVGSGTVTAAAGETIACETSLEFAITIDMPIMPLNKTVEVVDYDGDASLANPITVTPPTGWSIMDPNTGAYAAPNASVLMTVGGASVTWESDGGRNNRLFIL
jgi:hypothetical protein